MKEREATAVIDRYKYLDLYPCQENELKVVKYKVTSHVICFNKLFLNF